ncbi:hypothetical protein B5G12_11745 [Faecalibacterium sp. An58]|uniref:ketopantoate reductase family protein n=1 Tax=Faecalibacterium sp. An58 TaxID=1965648 RepID=UPI000B3A3BE1|nr:2-dehydropantoate 2-reductase [Faecalibacterium sp. An58]OUN69020.1 hypothetical protein B5G12_11745 [Faecalibacterium sp. An58]
MELYRVEQIAEGDYGCEELPEGAPVLCSVTLRGPDGASLVVEVPDQALTAQSIQEGCTVLRQDGSLQLVRPIRTSALIGLGALGILFGRKMPGVQVIADSQRAARYTAHPATCNGQPCPFSYCSPSQGQPADLALVTVKATGLEQAIRDIAPFVGPHTVILSLLNGITSEERLEAAYPGHTLWSVAIGMDANRVGRDLVFKAPGRIQFGERDGRITPRVAAVAQYFAACGIAGEPCTDILYKQWHKLMINVGLNQASAAFGMTYGDLAKDTPQRAKMLQAMQEVIRLANAEGVPLPPDDDVVWLAGAIPSFKPDNRPSMGQDIQARRPTEVEEFAGTVRRLSQKHGLPTPANDFFYQRIRAIEAGWAAQPH